MNATSFEKRKLQYNQNKHNYWFLISFSFLSIVFHLVPVSRDIHNILYSSNVFALIGYTAIVVFYPTRFYNYYAETFRHIIERVGLSNLIVLNIYTLHMYAWLFHAIPVWVFRNTYSLVNPSQWFLIYLILAGPFLGKIYNLAFSELALVCIVAISIYYVRTLLR
jgi:hypothetical protein